METHSQIVTLKNFHATKLNNDRNIFLYLPPSYMQSVYKKYPVLYMHDGQYAFASSENTGGSWNAHKVADKLIQEGKIKEIIIVAIPNMGNERGSEYAFDGIPFVDALHLKAKGLLYEDFLLNDLKPYIDKNYRTLNDPANTALLGSSMGGLVTYNLGFRNPQVFGNLAMMSPFLVSVNPNGFVETPNYQLYNTDQKPQKIWADIGEYENLLQTSHTRHFVDQMLQKGYRQERNLAYYDVPNGAHFEQDWNERLHAPLLFFFGKIGQRDSVQLCGRKTVGLNGGLQVRANPVVRFDSGFLMSDTDAQYIPEDPNILEISADGTIIPKKDGQTKVTYRSHGLETSAVYTVVENVPKMVNVTVNVNVPKNTPDDQPLTLNEYRLTKVEDGLYTVGICIPTDSGFTFKIARGDAFVNPSVEQDTYKKDIPYRRFKACEDLTINCTVESWKDL